MLKTDIIKNFLAKTGVDNLSSREKIILAGGIVFVISFLIFKLVISPFFEAKNNLEKSITRKKQELVKIKELQNQHNLLKNTQGNIKICIEKRPQQFSLFTFLERNADTSKVKKQIKSMKPSTSEGDNNLREVIVDLNIKLVTLESLVSFIKLVESEEKCVFIKRASIQESGSQQGYLDANLKVATFEIEVAK